MAGYPFDTFGTTHLLYLAGVAVTSILVLRLGLGHLGVRGRRRVALALALFSLAQELADDLLRVHHGVWSAQEALPLHLCSLGMIVSVWALLSKQQLVFEVAYYWVFAASTQALLTPDNSRWSLGELDVFWNFLSHGVIVLNVLWLVLVEGMRCRKGAWMRVFLITNLVTIPIAFINLALGANYFFICRKPGGGSPFLLGEWPWYILWFEVLALVFFWLLALPMGWANQKRLEGVPSAASSQSAVGEGGGGQRR